MWTDGLVCRADWSGVGAEDAQAVAPTAGTCNSWSSRERILQWRIKKEQHGKVMWYLKTLVVASAFVKVQLFFVVIIMSVSLAFLPIVDHKYIYLHYFTYMILWHSILVYTILLVSYYIIAFCGLAIGHSRTSFRMCESSDQWNRWLRTGSFLLTSGLGCVVWQTVPSLPWAIVLAYRARNNYQKLLRLQRSKVLLWQGFWTKNPWLRCLKQFSKIIFHWVF